MLRCWSQLIASMMRRSSISFTSTPWPMLASSVTVSSPPRCSRKSASPRSSASRPASSRARNLSCHSRKPSRSRSLHHAFVLALGEPPAQRRVAGVQRHSDGDRFAVIEFVIRQPLEPMRRPMAEIERARQAG